MIKILTSCLLLTIAAAWVRGTRVEFPRLSPGLIETGLDADAEQPSPPDEPLCSNLSLTRGLKYNDHEQNVLDVATTSKASSMPRPVLLFVAGQSFVNDAIVDDWAMREKAICLSARNGMVGVSMSYRRAPAHPWPAGAQDVAAATSWVHENIDLFGGDPNAVVLIGYSVGAFHVASFLAHRELQNADSDIAGAVLLSGFYSSGADADEAERAYLGTDTSLYDSRSAFPGIYAVEEPIVLAWSADDSRALVAQGENLEERLCSAGHCPRTAVLAGRDSPASVFGVNGDDDAVADRVRLLLDEIEARGLP